MRITRPGAALIVIVTLPLTGCGGSGVTVTAGGQSSTPVPTGSATAGGNAATSATVVVRAGGIAGVLDMVHINADGTASMTSKAGTSRACTPAAKDVDRLQAINLAAIQPKPSKPPMPDGFSYSVRSASGGAVVSEGDDNSRSAELLDAAAAVVASCKATQSGAVSTNR